MLLGSASSKTVRRTLMKLSSGVNLNYLGDPTPSWSLTSNNFSKSLAESHEMTLRSLPPVINVPSVSIRTELTPSKTTIIQWSISSTFFEQLLRQYYFAKKLETQTAIREKLCRTLSYEKGKRKMLMKLTPRE